MTNSELETMTNETFVLSVVLPSLERMESPQEQIVSGGIPI